MKPNHAAKALLFIVVATVVILAGFVGWYSWDSSRNRGNEFGYYGEFNHVSNALASIPGVIIKEAWYNGDITLEEFGFTITTGGQRPTVRLFFGETDQVREMSRDTAIAALTNRIARELSFTSKWH